METKVLSNKFILILSLILFNITYSGYIFTAQGDLDTTFNPTGTPPGTATITLKSVSSVKLQSDGKVVVAGPSSDNYLAATRYNTDGSLDTTFGGTGTVKNTALANVINGYVALAIQQDGKILVAGTLVGNVLNNGVFALVRFNADGSVDTTFGGGDGAVSTSIGTGAEARSIALQSDGKIILAGDSRSGGVQSFTLARYTTSGVLDTSFGVNGIATVSAGTDFFGDLGAYTIVALSDDSLLVGGSLSIGSDNGSTLLKFNPNGSLDTSFATDGMAIVDDEAYGLSLCVDCNNGILFAGYRITGDGTTEGLVYRYDSSGQLDTSFATNGVVTLSLAPTDLVTFNSIIYLPNGKFMIGGGWGPAISGSPNKAFLARYNGNGTLDASFGTGGMVKSISGPGQANDGLISIVAQINGNIVGAGCIVARYIGEGLLMSPIYLALISKYGL